MAYYYTPIKIDPSGMVLVAKNDGGDLVSAMEDLVGGIHNLKLDRDAGRYVLSCPAEQTALDGWEQKTAEEINADYPGLVGGA